MSFTMNKLTLELGRTSIVALTSSLNEGVKPGALKLKEKTYTVSMAVGGAVKMTAIKCADILKMILLSIGSGFRFLGNGVVQVAYSTTHFTKTVFGVLNQGMIPIVQGAALAVQHPKVTLGVVGGTSVAYMVYGPKAVIFTGLVSAGVISLRKGQYKRAVLCLSIPAACLGLSNSREIVSIASGTIALAKQNPLLTLSVVGATVATGLAVKYQVPTKVANIASKMISEPPSKWKLLLIPAVGLGLYHSKAIVSVASAPMPISKSHQVIALSAVSAAVVVGVAVKYQVPKKVAKVAIEVINAPTSKLMFEPAAEVLKESLMSYSVLSSTLNVLFSLVK